MAPKNKKHVLDQTAVPLRYAKSKLRKLFWSRGSPWWLKISWTLPVSLEGWIIGMDHISLERVWVIDRHRRGGISGPRGLIHALYWSQNSGDCRECRVKWVKCSDARLVALQDMMHASNLLCLTCYWLVCHWAVLREFLSIDIGWCLTRVGHVSFCWSKHLFLRRWLMDGEDQSVKRGDFIMLQSSA